MALEDQLAAHTKALEANTAAVTALLKHMQGGKADTAAAGKTDAKVAGKTETKSGKAVDRKAVVTIATRVKEEISEASAKNLIAKFADGGTLKDMKEGDYAKFYKAAEAALASGEEIEAEGGDEGGDDNGL